MQRLGGLARAAKMTPGQRTECARKAAITRWQKERKPKRKKLAAMRGQRTGVCRTSVSQASANVPAQWEPVMIPGCDT